MPVMASWVDEESAKDQGEEQRNMAKRAPGNWKHFACRKGSSVRSEEDTELLEVASVIAWRDREAAGALLGR